MHETPALGVNFDLDSTFIGEPPGMLAHNAEPHLRWFRTVIELDTASTLRWWSLSTHPSTSSIGTTDISWRDAAWSPPNISANGCVLATLSSNHELGIWTPNNNYLHGEWNKTQDLTEFLRGFAFSIFPGDSPDVELKRVLFCQIHCLAWSPCFEIAQHGFSVPVSILALGNRLGSVIFLRQDSEGMHQLGIHQFAEEWITKLAWSDWSPGEQGDVRGCLAVLTSKNLPFPAACTCSVQNGEVLMDINDSIRSRATDLDTRMVTSLKWIRLTDGTQVLVHTRPGTVHFDRCDDASGGTVSVRLSSMVPLPGASSASPISGIHYYEIHDFLLVALQDGSFHTIHDVSGTPTASVLGDRGFESSSLTQVVRAVFVEAERSGKERFDHREAMLLSGVAPLGSFGSVVWVHEAKRPDLYAYTPEALQRSMIVCQQLWSEETFGELVLAEIGRCLDHPESPYGALPSHQLSAVLLHLRLPSFVLSILDPLLALLSPGNTLAHGQTVICTNDSLEVLEARTRFRSALRKSLYGTAALVRNRVKLFIAHSCASSLSSSDKELVKRFVDLESELSSIILAQNMSVILHYLLASAEYVKDKDDVFISRVVLLGLKSSDAACVRLAQRAVEKFGVTIESISATYLEVDLHESCLICQAGVKFADYSSAVCATGHVWERCSITFELLEIPRTCVGCLRKAVLLDSGVDGEIGGLSWLGGDVLNAALGCLYCGSQFAKLI